MSKPRRNQEWRRLGTLFVAALCLSVMATPGAIFAQDAAQPEPAVSDVVNLQPRFVPGQVSRYAFWTIREQNLTRSVGDQSQSISVRHVFEGEITWEVANVEADGSARCVMTIDWITALLDNGQQRIRSDSREAAGDNQAVHEVLRAMSTVPLDVDVAPDGTVSGVSGVEAVQARASADARLPEDLDYIETATELATLAYAPAAIRPGGVWQGDFTWTHEMGKVDSRVTYTFNGVETIAGVPVANISTRTDLTLKPDRSKLGPPDGPEISVRMLEGEARGQVLFDLSRGEAVGRNNLQRSVVATQVRAGNRTLTQRTEERLQSQALRIDER